MESKITLFGHPVHPQLIVFPLGLFATAGIFDIISLITATPSFTVASFYMIAAGVIGGLLAAVCGFMDWLGLPKNSRARRIGGWHGLGNFVIVVLFAVSWLLRLGNGLAPAGLALALSFTGAASALITAWLGGEMVFRMGVAVNPNANVNASSSLSADSTAASSGNRAPQK